MSENKIPVKVLEDAIIQQLKMIYDPEIPVDIYNLGLIYDIIIDKENNIKIVMTLTAPNCPVAESLPQEVKTRIEAVSGVKTVEIEMTFDPPWSKDLLSDEAKLMLGMM